MPHRCTTPAKSSPEPESAQADRAHGASRTAPYRHRAPVAAGPRRCPCKRSAASTNPHPHKSRVPSVGPYALLPSARSSHDAGVAPTGVEQPHPGRHSATSPRPAFVLRHDSTAARQETWFARDGGAGFGSVRHRALRTQEDGRQPGKTCGDGQSLKHAAVPNQVGCLAKRGARQHEVDAHQPG